MKTHRDCSSCWHLTNKEKIMRSTLILSALEKKFNKCANVPLSIRVIASLLYHQDRNVWLSFRDNALGEISGAGDENSIMSTLMFRYYQLSPKLKSCFSFCSLFPKDYILDKELLINLWLAQGYLVAANSNAQSIEDVGERYITILLNRCFFQDIQRDEHGDVYSFKKHDLMHDLALKVAGNECSILTLAGPSHSGKLRHLSIERGSSDLCLNNTLRTYVRLVYKIDIADDSFFAENLLSDEVSPIVSNCRRLRVLSLPMYSMFTGCTLPDKVGKLLHLRYLDISFNKLEMLPKLIAKLYNLQILLLAACGDLKELPDDISKLVNLRTLYISDCSMLKELPKDISKLVNLRKLNISDCHKVTYMPRGMHNLTNLQRLSDFVVGGVDVKQLQGSKLVDLRALKNLNADLCIKILKFSSYNMPHATKRTFILKDARLKHLRIKCGSYYYDNAIEFDQSEIHETLVEDLCPNEDICYITMADYKGTKMPGWASLMEYSDMNVLRHMTSLSQFRCLKKLSLYDLPNVEYMEIENGGAWKSRIIFPVLEEIHLKSMPKLKGWWRGLRWREMEGGGGCLVNANSNEIHTEHAESFPRFSRLHKLHIVGCKSMTYFPPCPQVKQLKLEGVNEALTFCMKGSASSSNMSTSLCLEVLEIDNASVMNILLLSEFVGGAIKIHLSGDDKLKSMGTLRDVIERVGCILKNLTIKDCKELDIEDEEEEGMTWKYL